MKRSPLDLEDIADWHNLTAAFHRAALGKAGRLEVQQFRADWLNELADLRQGILGGTIPVGNMKRFRIRDPKPRIIHAPCFRERVLHHALMAHVGPVLDRVLIDDTYACRLGKGVLAAVERVQHHLRRFPWHAKIDIRGYFATIDHATLMAALTRRFKDVGLLTLMARIIDAHQVAPGRGLPIGALTSQHFANYYLAGADRLLLEGCRVRGLVRYMDDLVWWGDDRAAVRAALERVRDYLEGELGLEVKTPVQIGPSRSGLNYCGFRILPGRVLLSRRRKQRYSRCRERWERAYRSALIDGPTLQAGYATALAITAHTDASQWRREQLRRRPLVGPLLAV